MGLFNKLFGKKAEAKEVVTEVTKEEPAVTAPKEKVDNVNTEKMSNKIKFTIDGKECTAEQGQLLVDAAADNGVYIPVLCHMKDVIPAGACRICTVSINGRTMAACTTPVEPGMAVENNTAEIKDMRKAIVEALFVEGNHFCPSCEKSGNCDLQALGYKYEMMVPRFPYSFPIKEVDASTPNIYLDKNRCILCKKCIRTIKDDQGRHIFAYAKRGSELEISIDHKLAANMTPEQAQEAMDVCPVGAILRKGKGFDEPIGTRKYDTMPIGSDIENKV